MNPCQKVFCVLPVAFGAFALVACHQAGQTHDAPRVAAATASATAVPFTLHIWFEGTIAFVPMDQGVMALLVNTKTQPSWGENPALTTHSAAVRVRTQHLFPSGGFGSEVPRTTIPLNGVDISISNNCTTSDAFKITHPERLPQIKTFSAPYQTVLPACVGPIANVPKSRVSARYLLSAGILDFTKTIKDPGGDDIAWCFTKTGPTEYPCDKPYPQASIAQRATTDLTCTGPSFSLSLQGYLGGSLPITLYPDAANQVVVEILNVRPEDLAQPDAPNQLPLQTIDHFKWFYVLSKDTPGLTDRRFPYVAQNIELGGIPYCTMTIMER